MTRPHLDMQEHRTPSVSVAAGGICSMTLQCVCCQRQPPRDTGIQRAAFQANNTPIHYIRCLVTLTWTRVGTHAFLQGIPVFLRSIVAVMNHRPVKDMLMRCFILSVKFHETGMLPARTATGRPAPYAVSAARPGVQTNHLPKSPSPVVWP